MNPVIAKWLGKACFVKGTLIHTTNGLVPIEEIKSGDKVLSYNEQTKQTEYKPVIETYIRQTETIVRLQIEGEAKAIETTPEHPFFTRIHRARDSLSSGDDGEWKEAGKLEAGDKLLAPDGQWQQIVKVTRQTRNEQVYNFQVEGNHNYFVGTQGVLVHNRCAEFFGGNVSEGKILDLAERWLGKGHREISPGRWVSDDGLRQFRFGQHEVNASQLHVHFESYGSSYFTGGTLTENTFVNIFP